MRNVYTVEWDVFDYSKGCYITKGVSWYAIHAWSHFVTLKKMPDVAAIFVTQGSKEVYEKKLKVMRQKRKEIFESIDTL